MVSDRRSLHSRFSKRQSQESCTICPENPPCMCGPGQVCIEVSRTCHDCGSLKCVAQAIASPTATDTLSSSSAIGTGALAGAISGTGVLLLLVILAAFFVIKRQRRGRSKTLVPQDIKEKPARAEVVLQRPDPNTPSPTVYQYPRTPSFSAGESSARFQGSNLSSHAATQGHTPMSSQSSSPAGLNRSNPNLISATFNPSIRDPSADSVMFSSSRSQAGLPPLLPNVRAALGLPIDPTRGNSRFPVSQRADGGRNSVQTASSFSSEMSTEPVMAQGAVRQVLGITRAEVVRTPKQSMSSLYPSVHMSRLSGAFSTLAFSGGDSSKARVPPIPSRFGTSKRSPRRSDLEPLRNPFSDSHAPPSNMSSPDSPTSANSLTRLSPVPTSATFGDTGSPMRDSWAKQDQGNMVQSPGGDMHAGSAVSPSPPTGRFQPTAPLTFHLSPAHDLPRTPISAALSTARSPYESRVAGPSSGVLQRQQFLAIDGGAAGSRFSTVSSVADSLLSSFPFVPPSPHGSAGSHRIAQLPSSLEPATLDADGEIRYSASAYSGTHSAQSSPTDTQHPLPPGGRQRASLDTVALSSDLAKYPLRSSRAKRKSVQRTEQ